MNRISSATLVVLFLTVQASAAEKVELADGSKALHTVVVAPRASKQTRQTADTLADYLGRISGAKFEVATGDASRGIAVGTSKDFPNLKLDKNFDNTDAQRREEYLLRTHKDGLWLIGATELATEHAVWDLLYRLGYRQFFPGDNWEIVPQVENPSIAVDELQRPAYHSRRIWYGWAPWDYAREPYTRWCKRNRMAAGIKLNTGHSYGRFIRTMRKQFEAHPEYWPLLDGQRKEVPNTKPCLGNPAVRALFVKHALSLVEKDPTLDSVSMDPSDGGGWCQCKKCAALGSVSDQALTLANEVAAAINEKHPGKFVGMYAYNFHSPPPNVRAHPNVIVSVATAFIKGGLSLDEIISGWAHKGATLGIREYYSVNTWDRDQPGHARGGNIEYLRRTILEFHAKGARFMSAESSDNWGPNGLGYYLAARMLWDLDEVQQTDALSEDFLVRAFGPAREPMREFYRQIDSGKPHLVVDDQLGRMYGSLTKARKLADSPQVRARIDDLVLYARYCTLYYRYAKSQEAKRQAAFEALIRHAYRMRKTMMIHTKALYRDLVNRDKTVSIPEGTAWTVPEAKNPWKSSTPFSEAEIAAYIKEGIAAHKLVELDFRPVNFSSDLVPAAAVLQPSQKTPVGKLGPARGVQTFQTYFSKGPATLQLQITGGLIKHYRDRGNVKVEVYKLGGASQTGRKETLVVTDRSVPPDGIERAVKLKVPQPGLYKITVSDGGDRTLVTWPPNQPMTIISSGDEPMNKNYRHWMAYFYVPKGTKVIGLFGGQHGEIRDSRDRAHFWLNGREPSYYSVPVPPGEDGKVWRVQYVNGPLRLLTIPPYFSTNRGTLLLPREVVEKDAKQ